MGRNQSKWQVIRRVSVSLGELPDFYNADKIWDIRRVPKRKHIPVVDLDFDQQYWGFRDYSTSKIRLNGWKVF